eukprot:2051127-Prymnesium_polylepis.1
MSGACVSQLGRTDDTEDLLPSVMHTRGDVAMLHEVAHVQPQAALVHAEVHRSDDGGQVASKRRVPEDAAAEGKDNRTEQGRLGGRSESEQMGWLRTSAQQPFGSRVSRRCHRRPARGSNHVAPHPAARSDRTQDSAEQHDSRCEVWFDPQGVYPLLSCSWQPSSATVTLPLRSSGEHAQAGSSCVPCRRWPGAALRARVAQLKRKEGQTVLLAAITRQRAEKTARRRRMWNRYSHLRWSWNASSITVAMCVVPLESEPQKRFEKCDCWRFLLRRTISVELDSGMESTDRLRLEASSSW